LHTGITNGRRKAVKMRAYRQQSMGGKAPAERLLAFLLRKTSKLHSTFSENQEAQEDLICEIVSRTHLIKAGSKSVSIAKRSAGAKQLARNRAGRLAASQAHRTNGYGYGYTVELFVFL
jgi:hypothetical protein